MPDDASRIAAADLYEADYVAWAEAQAAALEAGRLDELDMVNLAEEVGDLGRSAQNSCRSYVSRIIEHLLKMQFVRSPRDLWHWRGEIAAFRVDLDRDLTPTIRRRLPAELPAMFTQQLGVLQRRGMVIGEQRVLQALPTGYSWRQITDPDFFPEPQD